LFFFFFFKKKKTTKVILLVHITLNHPSIIRLNRQHGILESLSPASHHTSVLTNQPTKLTFSQQAHERNDTANNTKSPHTTRNASLPRCGILRFDIVLVRRLLRLDGRACLRLHLRARRFPVVVVRLRRRRTSRVRHVLRRHLCWGIGRWFRRGGGEGISRVAVNDLDGTDVADVGTDSDSNGVVVARGESCVDGPDILHWVGGNVCCDDADNTESLRGALDKGDLR